MQVNVKVDIKVRCECMCTRLHLMLGYVVGACALDA